MAAKSLFLCWGSCEARFEVMILFEFFVIYGIRTAKRASFYQTEYQKAVEDADEKVSIATQIYDLVDKHLRKLDQELSKFKMELEADNAGITEVLEQQPHIYELRTYHLKMGGYVARSVSIYQANRITHTLDLFLMQL
ncbi:predicted protein [Nematostella vectensis]|uniref:Inhibitor of growth protein N-terminal histone-binding domain-containing protein n=1 Tax=Nematostella vectensis TaxID=45351 RepID=A7SY96_NEMVE|nr:predicted protein [Nematostella vectensis]|eukprot:XP_001623428.1 predicted protein [Nematostella vectensis]